MFSQRVSPPSAALLAPAAAVRAPAPRADRLWATVNVCDTAKHPNEVGIRASMPGTPRGAARRMRFRVQWRDGDRWRYVTGADSGWRKLTRVARARDRVGLELRVRAAGEGRSRSAASSASAGCATAASIGRAVEITEAGHRSTAGADPEGYSAATCSIA